MTVSESYPTIHLGGLSNKILSEIGNVFSRTKTFCFVNSCFVLISVPNSIPKRRNYGYLAL